MPGYELFGAAERKEVNDVLETGILMRYGFDGARQGIWKAKELEAEICKTFGTAHTQLLSSGTAALTTAMAALGIGAGDEVIMPTFTFVASFEAVLSVGAIPVPVDIDETLTLNPAAVAAAITPRTKAVMPVHMCGSMAQLDELKAICTANNIFLLEDACQAIGGTYKGKHLGTIGDAGTFSFDFVKIITCAEGGAVMTNNKETYAKADQYTDHGHDHMGKDRGADLHPYLGYNFRISELHAAVGLAQVRRLDEFLTLQKKNHSIIYNALKQVEGVTFRVIPDPSGDTGSFVSFFLPTEEMTRDAVAAFAAEGIGGNFYWYDNNWHYIRKWQHLQSGSWMNRFYDEQKKQVLHYANQAFPVSDAIMSRCISSSISLVWTEEQAQERGNKMADVLKKIIVGATV
ncbi:L-glutamine--2-deoxy-scyllo-inosose aminotransferase KanB [Flavipsychrobacter stenotrophus]|uniref:L-glutamine--2-deoxy-scyllo-inosose aminotransferase KanB n=1 Tax=Flavipsychrobacter stenotrophus TaxID=2077091 RepID=A0A2S7SVP6_9BACT|nr:DegT/DnrJ/EryC1/StrS family aminotransferase [Flavipsychrobacter stenotrophus]PQJ10675.1 L-glutamine--2-deoxy-scyllo-inosose aminotransferase KanB [Flavipsychrobacter stenotrophus]